MRPQHAAHRNDEQRRGENQAHPEAAVHVAEFGILFLLRGDRARLERHAADGTTAGLGADDLRMHRAGVLDLRHGQRALRLERHAAAWAWTGADLVDLRAHGTNVGALLACGGLSVSRNRNYESSRDCRPRGAELNQSGRSLRAVITIGIGAKLLQASAAAEVVGLARVLKMVSGSGGIHV